MADEGRIQYTMEIPNLKALGNFYSHGGNKTKEAIRAALARAAIQVQAIARAQAPVRTGRLRNSIMYRVSAYQAIISVGVKYGIYVEGGTGLYGPNKREIVPKKKKVLATKDNPGWGAASNGYYIIGRKSRGQKANPFMKRTADMARLIVANNFRQAEKELIKYLKG